MSYGTKKMYLTKSSSSILFMKNAWTIPFLELWEMKNKFLLIEKKSPEEENNSYVFVGDVNADKYLKKILFLAFFINLYLVFIKFSKIALKNNFINFSWIFLNTHKFLK